MSKKAKLVNKWNPANKAGHINSGEVITKPNQHQSVRDILFRNTQGMTYDNYKTPYYEEQATFSSQSLNKIQEMEPTEKLQYLKELNDQIKSLKSKIQEDEAEKASKIADAEAQAKLEEHEKQKENNTETESK